MTNLTRFVRSKGDPKIIETGPSSLSYIDRLGRSLGWFSIGLGLTELIAPHRLTRMLGMRGMEGFVRACGARELASGTLSLSTEKSIGLWSRVAGDAIDVAALATALHPWNRKRGNVKLALAAVIGVTVLDVLAATGAVAQHRRTVAGNRSYHARSGFPNGVERARGLARSAARQEHAGGATRSHSMT